jgi:hypothetical protein
MQTTGDFITTIADEVHAGDLAGQQILLWPSVARLYGLFWKDRGVDDDIAEAEAEARIRGLGIEKAHAEGAIVQLVRTALLESYMGRLTLPKPYRPFLAAMLSGHSLEIAAVVRRPRNVQKVDRRVSSRLPAVEAAAWTEAFAADDRS